MVLLVNRELLYNMPSQCSGQEAELKLKTSSVREFRPQRTHQSNVFPISSAHPETNKPWLTIRLSWWGTHAQFMPLYVYTGEIFVGRTVRRASFTACFCCPFYVLWPKHSDGVTMSCKKKKKRTAASYMPILWRPCMCPIVRCLASHSVGNKNLGGNPSPSTGNEKGNAVRWSTLH